MIRSSASSAPARSCRTRRSTTSPGSRRSRCRWNGTATTCRSVCISWRRSDARTCCCGSPRNSNRRDRGRTAFRRFMPENITVAGGQGFYGDTPAAVDALLAEGVDYLCLEALAELTLAILQKDRQRDEARGYTRDLPGYLARALPFVANGRTKVITNAGGINPPAAAHAAIETAKQLGLHGLKIATVLGDDVLSRLEALRAGG